MRRRSYELPSVRLLLYGVLAFGMLVSACAPTDDIDEVTDEPEEPGDADDVDAEADDPQELEELSVTIGFVPFSAFGATVSEYMRDNGLVEERGRELGLELDVEWGGFPGCPPQIAQMIPGDLDISGCGFIPTTRAMMEGQDLRIFSIYEGSLDVWLAVRPDSGISSVEDLRGRTIGTFLGGDIEFFLTQLLDAHLGSPNPTDHDINVVDVPSPAAMADMPTGVDAVTIFGPHFLRGQEAGTLEGLVSNQGQTGSAWAQGEDAGPPEEMTNSPAYPEGYMLHRAVWVARGEFVDEHPEVIEAFLLAQHDALQELTAMDPVEVAEISAESWEISGELGASIVESDLLWKRGWPWWTRGDVEGVARNGEIGLEAGVFEEAISLEELLDGMRVPADIAERAYEAVGFPEHEEFLDEEADIRGEPVWEMLDD